MQQAQQAVQDRQDALHAQQESLTAEVVSCCLLGDLWMLSAAISIIIFLKACSPPHAAVWPQRWHLVTCSCKRSDLIFRLRSSAVRQPCSLSRSGSDTR